MRWHLDKWKLELVRRRWGPDEELFLASAWQNRLLDIENVFSLQPSNLFVFKEKMWSGHKVDLPIWPFPDCQSEPVCLCSLSSAKITKEAIWTSLHHVINLLDCQAIFLSKSWKKRQQCSVWPASAVTPLWDCKRWKGRFQINTHLVSYCEKKKKGFVLWNAVTKQALEGEMMRRTFEKENQHYKPL